MSAKNQLCLLFFLAFCIVSSIAQDQPVPQHTGRVHDWTSQHVVLGGGLTAKNWQSAEAEPRLRQQLEVLQRAERVISPDDILDPFWLFRPGKHTIIDGSTGNGRRGVKIDWAVNLGTGHVPANMFPAKYSFNTNSTPTCTDFVVYGLNVAGAKNGQANMVGINNLYSGNPAGMCGAAPTVNWAYNGSTAGGSVITSPVLSLNGNKIAYVESAAASTVFHILTWVSAQGTVTKAVNPSVPNACTGATSCLLSVTVSSTATDTFSSPWVDYGSDKGFVATDDGKLYRISCVFTCGTNSNPTIDWTYTLPVAGTGGATPRPGAPVYNSPYGYVIIGDQLGELWVINAGTSTPTLHAGPVMIGGGGCTVTNPPGRTATPSPCTATGTAFGIPDPVLVDANAGNEKVFAFSGNNGTNAVVAQLNQELSQLVSVPIGEGGVDIHNGAFDNNYFGSTPANGHLFLCGTGTADTTPYHYWMGFTAYPLMNSTPNGSLQRLAGANGVACVPYTEFYNPNLNLGGITGDHDLLASGLVDATNGYIITNDISAGSVPGALNFVQYPGGISGIVVDNDSLDTQASSVYFSTLGSVNVGNCANHICAVKLTQGALQ